MQVAPPRAISVPVRSTSANQVSREAVKTLAIAVGVREAARQLGLTESRVLQWSKREKWFAPTPQPPNQGVITVIKKPSQALSDSLQDDSKATRIGFSKAARKASEKLAQMPSETLLEPAVSVSASKWHGIASGTHGWAEKGNSGINLQILNITGQQP